MGTEQLARLSQQDAYRGGSGAVGGELFPPEASLLRDGQFGSRPSAGSLQFMVPRSPDDPVGPVAPVVPPERCSLDVAPLESPP